MDDTTLPPRRKDAATAELEPSQATSSLDGPDQTETVKDAALPGQAAIPDAAPGDWERPVDPSPFTYDEPTRDLPPVVATPRSPSSRPVRGSYPGDSVTATSQESRGGLYLIGALLAAVVGSMLTVGLLALTGTFDDPPVAVSSPPVTVVETSREPTQIINDIGAAVNPTAIAAKVFPSIVTVSVLDDGADSDGNPAQIITGSGSGVVQSTDGYIITNHHVIDGGNAYAVTFEDGRRYEAQLIGSDSLTDLAVLQISASGLVPIEYGSTDSLAIGDPAVAVGNPLGQDGGSSITAGIISAFNRRVDFADTSSLFGMIQTDAAINSGSSGGALVDAEGRLIGITSAIGVSTAGPEGIGYAIPIELVKRITDEIIETGDVEHPFMGVTMSSYLSEADDGAIVPAGAIIGGIEDVDGFPSAAGAAGIEPGDVIIKVGDEPISSQSDLILAVRLYRVGDVVTFTVVRDGEELTFDVTLAKRPPEFEG
jgi:S1-C subfamily serine protease